MLPVAGRRCVAACASRAAPRMALARAAWQPPMMQVPRTFASGAAGKVVKTLDAEIKHEDEQYEQPKELQAFLKNSDFKLADTEGDVNLVLERTVGDKVVRIEWQLSGPFSPEEDAGG